MELRAETVSSLHEQRAPSIPSMNRGRGDKYRGGQMVVLPVALGSLLASRSEYFLPLSTIDRKLWKKYKWCGNSILQGFPDSIKFAQYGIYKWTFTCWKTMR